MTEVNQKVSNYSNQRLVDAEAKTTLELHPKNRNEEQSLNGFNKPLEIKIMGTLTSQIQLRGERSEKESAKQGTKVPYYYAFIRLKGQSIDLPVIFKVKGEQGTLTEPKLKKNDTAELTGHYSNSEKSVRKSFTATAYQLLNKELNIAKKYA